jgi:hypothetical protein
MQFELELATPSILLNVKVKDASGQSETHQVEFKRYGVQESYDWMAKWDECVKTTKLALEPYEGKEDSSILECPEFRDELHFLAFVKNHVVDFKNAKAKDEVSGKAIKVPSVKDAGHLDHYLTLFWNKSQAHRTALKDACLQAIQNTSNNASLAA